MNRDKDRMLSEWQKADQLKNMRDQLHAFAGACLLFVAVALLCWVIGTMRTETFTSVLVFMGIVFPTGMSIVLWRFQHLKRQLNHT